MNDNLQERVEFLEMVYKVNAALELYEKHVEIAAAKYNRQFIKIILHYKELRENGSLEERVDYLELVFDVKADTELYYANNKLASKALGEAQFSIIDEYASIIEGGER